jgi:4,5-dihydroxyphthalate decarboxylase
MDRREVLKALGAAAFGSTLNVSGTMANAGSNNKLQLRLAGYDYDKVAGLMNGSVKVDGCDVSFEVDRIGNLNTDALGGPMTRGATEIGLVPYVISYANAGLRNHTLIPVFPLKVFRHKSIYIRPDRGIERPEDLLGKRIATPGYSSSSLTWIRGILKDEYGVSPEDIHWVIAKEDSAGADTGGASEFENQLPSGLDFSEGPAGLDESDLLVTGEVDGLFHAAEPKAFSEGNPNCVRLFSDSRTAEQDYYKKTGIFPIMHAVAVRRDLVEEHPWLIRVIFQAYSEAKQQVYDFQRRHAWYKTTMPWVSQELEETRAVMGNNFYSYGFTENNRKSIDALLRYCYEQGLSNSRLEVEKLFHSSTLKLIES